MKLKRNSNETQMKPNKNEKKEKNEKNEKKPPAETVVLPFESEQFKTAWAGWVDYRKEIKKAMKPTTVKAQLKKLSKLPEKTAVEVMELSIENGWTGLFPEAVKLEGGKSPAEKEAWNKAL